MDDFQIPNRYAILRPNFSQIVAGKDTIEEAIDLASKIVSQQQKPLVICKVVKLVRLQAPVEIIDIGEYSEVES